MADNSSAIYHFHSLWLTHPLIESLDTHSLIDICSMEITSDECLSEVHSLLSCQSKITAAKNLQGNEAHIFIDFLDRVSGHCVPSPPLET